MSKTRMKVAGLMFALVVAFVGGVLVSASNLGDIVSAQSNGSTTPALKISVFNQVQQPSDVDMSQFWQAWSDLQDNYVVTHPSSTLPTTQQKVYGAIAGLADSYGDPYTVFFPPAQAADFTSEVTGSFAGVGMEMNQDDQGNLIVSSPLKGSPAAAAGVLSGDIILQIDATSTAGMSLDEAVAEIRGPVGSTVKLTIARKGETQPVVVSIVRQNIAIPEINDYARADGIYVIQLYTFTSNSADLFRDALRRFEQSGDTRLIFDLRGNPGGYLDQAVQMASYFLPVGDTIVTEDFEGKQDNVVNRSLGYNVFAGKNLHMAILVDQNSASASEIFSGALQQHGVAKLVGTRTFGKGSVQQVMDLGNGAELKVTIARWLTPNGQSIMGNGIQPDIAASSTTPDNVKNGQDPTMDAAANWLHTQ
ncbi:MAG TPA: S41 family peptidase [Candidatus Paceibacterota bacterium]|nr:S41 family peptidase [Candidatus Paceibacterota bacterium]